MSDKSKGQRHRDRQEDRSQKGAGRSQQGQVENQNIGTTRQDTQKSDQAGMGKPGGKSSSGNR